MLRYTREWQDYVTRQARWVDFENDYKTLDLPYMESVMWAFKQLWDKGLVYQGFKVLPYCWRCETPLSNHELRMDDDVYRDRQDPSVTVRFKLETGEWLLAWTTTPWTLPSNLACAVGAGHQLRVVRWPRTASGTSSPGTGRPPTRTELEDADRGGHADRRGAGSAGATSRCCDYLADTEKFGTGDAFRVIPSDDVTTEDGTGVVHMAPAYGEADALACNAAGIPIVLTVDEQGPVHLPWSPTSQGLHVFEANKPIIARLRAHGRPGARARPTRTPTRTAGAAATR